MKPTLRLILSIFCLTIVFGLNAQSTITSVTSDTIFFLRKIFRSAIIAVILLIFSTLTLQAQTVTLTSIADNDIFLGNPTRNYGQSPYMYVIQGSSVIDRSLVKFNLSGIPSNATIISATLTLVKIGIDNDAMNIATHQITSPWTEGTGGSNGKPEESNWNQRVAGTNWTTAGGDFNPTAETTTAVSNNGSYTWNIPAMVQNWVTTPGINHGVLLKSTTEAGSIYQHVFASREYPTVTDRPKLVVTYTTAPTIATGTISPTTYCSGSTVNVPFTISGTFTGGNVFTAQLSNASGSFASPVSIGTLTGTTSGTISATIPTATGSGTGYRIRVVSSNPVVTGSINGTNITINAIPTITGTTSAARCGSGTLNLGASASDGTINWYAAATGGSSLGTGVSFTTPSISTTTTYYVDANINGCISATRSAVIATINLPTPSTPGSIAGTTTQCPSLKGQTYSISAVPNATIYTWTVPAGWIINSGAGTTSITVTTGTSGGNITVTAGNSCGTSAPSTLAVSVNPSSIDFDGIDDYIDFGNVHSQTGIFSVEAWILQEAATTTGAIISKGDVKSGAGNQRGYHLVLNNGKPNLTWYNNTGTTILNIESPVAISNNEWHHIAAIYNGTDAILYVDGTEVKRGNPSTAPVSGTESFLIGAMYDSTTPTNPKNYFNGFIDEVRVWNVALTEQQIHEMMNQEIQMNGTAVKGKIISKDISGGCLWANLKGYYPMNDGTATDLSSNGKNGIPKNICLSQAQTAPMPYMTVNDGPWTNTSTWLHGDVWDIENSASNKDWSIIKISNDVTVNHALKTSGLIIDANKSLTMQGDNLVENSWYLELNGTLNLQQDSQLIQTTTSDLVTSATGKIVRRQEGVASSYWYNYWGSPVGAAGSTPLTNNNASTNNPNNTNFRLELLKDSAGFPVQFTSAYSQPGFISTYWLYTFMNGVTYWDWVKLLRTANIKPGVGYTQKGTGNAGTQEQYIFEGKPNNGTIKIDVTDKGGPGSVASVSATTYLLGNPYPSALDIHKFIDDNAGVISGTLQLWQQWGGTSHYLSEYEGGYAQVTKAGAVKAYQFVGINGDFDAGAQNGTKTPTRYLPVGQGFIVEIIANGQVEFNNSQRVFIKEADANGAYDNGSVFMKSGNTKSKGESTNKEETQVDPMQRIRLQLSSVTGPATHRELLLAFSDFTTDAYDYGYEAECAEINNNDLNLNLEGKNMNIQAYSPITDDKVIPLNFKSSGNNSFEIKITQLENIDSSQPIYLKDNLTGEYIDLTQNQAYSFNSAAGKFNNRFEIVFRSESKALSVEEAQVTENLIYYQNASKMLFAKKINGTVTRLALVNMRGQSVMELSDISQESMSNGIKIPNVSTGTYIAYFRTDDNQVITKKIIVN